VVADLGGAGAAGIVPERHSPLAALWGLVAILAAVAIALPLAAQGGSGTGGQSSARRVMTGALTASMSQRTVQVSFTASVDADGMSAQVSGTGAADLTSKSAVLHMSGTVAGQREAVSIVAVGGTFYVEIPQVATVDPGKSWLSVQPGTSTSLGPVGGLGTVTNPGTILSFLRRAGAQVTSLGPSTLDGERVEGYRVTVDPAAIAAASSASGVPAGIARDVHQLVVTVYVSGRLLRALDVAETGQVSVSASINFHGYGEPVNVQPPAPASVVPFSQLAHQLPGLSQTA
jgi:hypothetical protein